MKQFLNLFLVIVLVIIYSQNSVNAESTDNDFLIEPYLLEVDKTSATVAFHLKNNMDAKVAVYDNDKIIEFKSDTNSKSHFIKISGLKSGNTYNYQVICGNGTVSTPLDDKSYQIRTACNKGESFSFIVYGDPRPGENLTNKHHKEIINQVIKYEPSFSLVLGDMVDDGTNFELWKDFFYTEKKLLRKAAIYPVIGDNDYVQGKGLVKDYFPLLKNGYYHFEWGDVHFFGMNAWDSRGFQSKKELNAESEQVQWLESQLSNEDVQNSLYRVVFLHDPVMISRGYSSEILKRVWEPVFKKYNVDLVFASWHMYERSQYNGIRYIITGGAGAELLWMNKNPDYSSQAESEKYHFCKVDVNAGALTISAIDVNDTILDSLTISPQNKTADNSHNLKNIEEKVRQEIIFEGGKNLPSLDIYLFSSGCSYCHKLLSTIFPRLAKQYQISLNVYHYNLELHENVYELLLSAGADFGSQNSDIPTIFIGNQVFGGEQEIENSLEKEFSDFRQNPEEYTKNSIIPFQDSRDTKIIKEKTFDTLSFGIVFNAGLIDGMNPCVYTTLFFLILYLIIIGGSSRKRFVAGAIFVAAIFLTYLLIGLLFFKVALLFSGISVISIVIKRFLLFFLIVLIVAGILYYVNRITGSTNNVIMQLSQFVHKNIYCRIRFLAKNNMIIVLAALTLGVVVAGMELACIGQVYIPIVTMISEPVYRVRAVGYLFSYTLAFILPVIIVYFMVLTGITLRKKYDQK